METGLRPRTGFARDSACVCVLLGLLITLGACKRLPGDDEVGLDEPANAPTAVARSKQAGGIATSLAIPDALPTLPVQPYTGGPPPSMNIAPAADSGAPAFPLSWSPDGTSLLALLPTGRSDALGRPMGRLVVLDTTGALTWDSGDLEAPIGGQTPADWLADGTLVLARRDGTFVRPNGSQASSASGLEGQPREVWVAPRRQRALLLGPDAAFVVRPGQAALRLDEWPLANGTSPQPGFAWSPDGGRIAVSAADGRHLLFDASNGTAALLLEDGSHPWEVGPPKDFWPAPTWLADGRLLLGTAIRRRYSDGDVYDHRIVNTTSARALELASTFGLEPLEQSVDASVSANGRYVLRSSPSNAEASDGRAWLIDVLNAKAQSLPGLGEPLWSPGGDRWLRMDAAGIALITKIDENDALVQLPVPLESEAGLREASWSPDGRWILVLQEDGNLVLVDAEGLSAALGIRRLNTMLGTVEEPFHVAWAADGRRLALRMARPVLTDDDNPLASTIRLFIVKLASGS